MTTPADGPADLLKYAREAAEAALAIAGRCWEGHLGCRTWRLAEACSLLERAAGKLRKEEAIRRGQAPGG